jgi:hypothetical protein
VLIDNNRKSRTETQEDLPAKIKPILVLRSFERKIYNKKQESEKPCGTLLESHAKQEPY